MDIRRRDIRNDKNHETFEKKIIMSIVVWLTMKVSCILDALWDIYHKYHSRKSKMCKFFLKASPFIYEHKNNLERRKLDSNTLTDKILWNRAKDMEKSVKKLKAAIKLLKSSLTARDVKYLNKLYNDGNVDKKNQRSSFNSG